MNKKGRNVSTAKRWRKFRDHMMLVLLMSSENEVTLFTRKEIWQQSETWCPSEDTYVKILEHNKRYFCPPATVSPVLCWALYMTSFTNSHCTLMRYVLSCHSNRWGETHLKHLRQGHLANMDWNPGLWLTLNYLVNQIIKLINYQIKSVLLILTTTLY